VFNSLFLASNLMLKINFEIKKWFHSNGKKCLIYSNILTMHDINRKMRLLLWFFGTVKYKNKAEIFFCLCLLNSNYKISRMGDLY
jgi:hypothetical protein